ncbi:MAG: exosortase family protein XrtF [Flavobacteriaceae bacterium]
MRSFFHKYKGVIKFLGVFTMCYVVLYALYTVYLKLCSSPDRFTIIVAEQCTYLIDLLGYTTRSEINTNYNHIRLFINDIHIAGVAEGCNAISIIILFTSFIIAFAKDIKQTALYILFGIFVIHLINIIRIVLLIICIHHYPSLSEALHSYIFPGIIYCCVFILWVFWVKSFKSS